MNANNETVDVVAVMAWKVKQTYTRWSNLPRWIVVHNRDGALMHPATIRMGARIRTWSSEAKAQTIADDMNRRYAASAAEAAALARVGGGK